MILLDMSAGILYVFLRLKGVHRIGAVFSAILFVVSAPVFENYYTVFKNEPIMLIWVVLSLLLGRLACLKKRKWERILLYAGIAFSTFMAMASKETAAIIPAIYLGWYLISLLKKDQSSPDEQKNSGFVFLASLVALVVHLTLKQYFVPPDQVELQGDARNYQFTLTQFSDQALRWLGLFIRDYPYLLPLAGFLLSRNIRQRISSSLLSSKSWCG